MKFSIVIPTYNGERYIEQALLSVLHQTRQPDEIIICDDNSTDKTLKICRQYEGNLVRIYCNSHGPSSFVNAWNNAIKNANFEYISILHQDDFLYPTFLEEAENALKQHCQVKHLFAKCHTIDSNGNICHDSQLHTGAVNLYSGYEYACLYRGCKGHIHRCPGVITHRDIFQVCSYRKEAGHIADDDFFYRVAELTNVIGIMKPLAAYRVHSHSETGHLGDIQLNSRLMKDFLFQLKNPSQLTLLDNIHHLFFITSLISHSKRLLKYSIKNVNIKLFFISFKNLAFAFKEILKLN